MPNDWALSGGRCLPVRCNAELDACALQQLLELLHAQPASRTMPPIVTACTGLCRGMVTKWTPSDMTMCLPSRMILKPAFQRSHGSEVRNTRDLGQFKLPPPLP